MSTIAGSYITNLEASYELLSPQKYHQLCAIVGFDYFSRGQHLSREDHEVLSHITIYLKIWCPKRMFPWLLYLEESQVQLWHDTWPIMIEESTVNFVDHLVLVRCNGTTQKEKMIKSVIRLD